ncbi:MAG: LacI family transcriptional regulator [Nitrosomonadaceae bacterium]|jgi:LacI family transcriptional regulator|nr:LacI family transcriptional regulator [Nitrosomonadaceae bacterium]
MINVKQVAALAGVSTTTVSRSYSDPDRVHPDTLRRVKQAISQLGYVPFASARGLRVGRTLTVGILVPTLMNELYAKAVDVLEERLNHQGFNVLLTCHRNNAETEMKCARALLGRQVEALVMIGAQHHPELIPLIHRQNIPYVLMWAIDPTGSHSVVGYDNRLAMRHLTEHLIELGHRHFAVLPGPLGLQDILQQRLDGIKDALVSAGISLHGDQVLPTDYTTSSIRNATRTLLRGNAAPTALMCSNDLVAAAAIAECHALNISVPNNVSVTGFGDWQLAELITPTLTTVKSNPVYIGETTATLLASKISGMAGAKLAQSQFEAQMVFRDSTAAAPMKSIPQPSSSANPVSNVR